MRHHGGLAASPRVCGTMTVEEIREATRMAEIVCAIGVPHTPQYPALVAREGPECEVARLFRAVREQLEAVQPDVLVIYDSDHVNTFFFDNWPTFAIGAEARIEGPNDDNTELPHAVIPGDEALGMQLYTGGMAAGFDFSLTQRFTIDHSIMVPLHFITPRLNVPIVPIFINGVQPPLPAARRCFALGEAVRAAIESWPRDVRVAIVASGSFSLDVGGAMTGHRKRAGVPDQIWVQRVATLLSAGKVSQLLEETTADQMARAGNVGGEVLNWIALLGTLNGRRPSFMEPQVSEGHAYGVWRWD
jgi:gallate dioxygenase